MSPTPDQRASRYQAMIEEIAGKEGIQKKLSGLNIAIESVSEKCREIVGGEIHKDDCTLAGYILDNTKGISSLHPIILESTFPGGVATDSTFLMLGKNFAEKLELTGRSLIRNGEFPVGDVSIKYQQGWEEQYPAGSFFIWENGLSVVCSGRSKPITRGIIDSHCSTTKPGVSIEEEINVKEAMVVALANAAGIKAADEKSDDFPLLLDQLKRIEAGKTLSEK